ncbi:DUF6588 family protein [Echinicola salinicaeni]|uniref:DUF6588 family protein n=1 Tax=Echinicola salinicaeni TaxID=2762757 RepID=UPI0016445881|nr:DUF6588 family protein [Echinicola salinicaeni]
MKKILHFCLFGLILMSSKAFGQGDVDVEQILRAGAKDLNTYMGYYVEPAAKGFIYSMGSGWAQTAKPHSTLGFDIKFGLGAASVPSKHESFTFDPNEYDKLRLINANGPTELPTLFGATETNSSLGIYEDGELIAEVEVPPGIDIPVKYVPAPTIQAALGLPAGFELVGRFIPELKIDDAKVSQWGLGIKHDIKQHIPGLKLLPFDLSALAAYNHLKSSYIIDETENQHGKMNVESWTFQGIISKKLSIITFYGAFGYNTGKSAYSVLGDYYVEGVSEPLTDPVDLKYEIAGAMGTLGLRFKFGPIFLNGDYTFQEYNTINVGLGVSIR